MPEWGITKKVKKLTEKEAYNEKDREYFGKWNDLISARFNKKPNSKIN